MRLKNHSLQRFDSHKLAGGNGLIEHGQPLTFLADQRGKEEGGVGEAWVITVRCHKT